MSTATIAIVFVLIVITVGFLGIAIYMKLRRRFTRDRYAFAALGATVTLVCLAVASVGTAPPWTIIAALIAQLFDNPALALSEPNWAEKALVVGLVAFALWLLHRTFVLWDGLTSVRQHRISRLRDSSTYLSEGIAEILRMFHREPPSPVYAPTETAALRLHIEAPAGTRAWRDDARELAELKWQQYIFDPDEGWHEKHSCWVGSDVKTKNNVALMCCQESPCQDALSQFVAYVCALPSVSAGRVEFIVAARTGGPRTISINDHLVRIECEDSLLEGLVDFTDYVVDIRRRVEKEPLPDSELTISDVYVASEVVDANGNEVTGSLEDCLLSWLAEPGQRHLAILGEYGQGKSTGTLMFTHRLLTASKTTDHPLPLFLELRGKSPSTLQPVELLGAWASAYRIDPRALLKLLIKGRVFVIFEGFDEMAGVADRDSRINHFRALWRFAYPNAKLLFTGRPNLFLDDAELKSALGMCSGPGSGPYCEHISLKPFRSAQIRDSLRWASSSVRDEILALSQKDEKFRDIVSRPSLLYIVGRLWESPDFARISETVDAAQVMGAFVRHCYRRQTEKHRGFPRFMVLTEPEREYFMDGVAAFMAAGRMPNQITRHQFELAVSELYEVIPDDLLQEASLPEPFDGPLKTRMADRDDAIEAVQTDVRTCGLLVRDYSRPSALKFPHKSFFEYLLGAIVADYLLGKRTEYCAAIRSAASFDPVNAVDVPESLSFLGEIIDRSISSRRQPEATINTLLDAIVMPRAFRIPRHFRKLYLRLIVAMMMPGFKWIVVLPLCIVMAFLSAKILLMHPTTPNLVQLAITTLVLMFIMLCMILMMGGINRFRSITLWYAVAKSLRISDADIVSEYGKRTTSAIQRIASRILSRGDSVGSVWKNRYTLDEEKCGQNDPGDTKQQHL